MLKTIVLDYLRLLLFAVGLLLGLQIPALVDQYQKRVDARLTEASQNLAGFQMTADRYFQGSVEKLIEHYKNSDDQIFRQDANNILAIFNNVQRYQLEMDKLVDGGVSAAFHVMFRADQELMEETLSQFTYTVVLSPPALAWGLILAFLFAVLAESLIRGGLYILFKPKKVEDSTP